MWEEVYVWKQIKKNQILSELKIEYAVKQKKGNIRDLMERKTDF